MTEYLRSIFAGGRVYHRRALLLVMVGLFIAGCDPGSLRSGSVEPSPPAPRISESHSASLDELISAQRNKGELLNYYPIDPVDYAGFDIDEKQLQIDQNIHTPIQVAYVLVGIDPENRQSSIVNRLVHFETGESFVLFETEAGYTAMRYYNGLLAREGKLSAALYYFDTDQDGAVRPVSFFEAQSSLAINDVDPTLVINAKNGDDAAAETLRQLILSQQNVRSVLLINPLTGEMLEYKQAGSQPWQKILDSFMSLTAQGVVRAAELPTPTAPQPLPTEVPTPLPTEVPIPTLENFPGVPDPRITNPELFDLTKRDSPIPQFVNAMRMAGIEVTGEQVAQGIKVQELKDKNGNTFLIGVYNNEVLGKPVALLIAIYNLDSKEWQWQRNNLKKSADLTGKIIGVAGQYKDKEIMSEDFNSYSSDWAFQWNVTDPPLRPSENNFNFKNTDYAVNFANQIGSPQIHHLIWGLYGNLPDWLKNGNLSRDDLLKIIENHVKTMVGRYKGKVSIWSVVNEPFGIPENQSFWEDRLGKSSTDWIDLAFITAHEADPEAKLILNDFFIEFNGDRKSEKIFQLIKGMKERQVPINGVGFQMHINATDFNSESRLNSKVDALITNINRYQEIGVEVIITELDVNMHGIGGTKEEKIRLQAEIYYRIVKAAIQAGVKNITIFGVKDGDSWLESYYGQKDADALLFDDSGLPKLDYWTTEAALLDL